MSEITQLIEEAKVAYRKGQLKTAQQRLKKAVQIQPYQPKLWLALAKTASTPQEAYKVLQTAQKFHPTNAQIGQAKQKLQTQSNVSSAVGNLINKVSILYAALFTFTLLFAFGLFTVLVSPSREAPDQIQRAAIAPDSIPIAHVNPIPNTAVPPNPVQIAAKQVNGQNNPLPTWTVTSTPSPTPTATPSIQPTFVSSFGYTDGIRPCGISNNERWIDVNLSTQVLIAYEGDQIVYSSVISSGTSDHPTVTGQFRIWLRYQSQTMDGTRLGYDYYLENVPYVMYFFEDYAIHGTYWHNNFGTPMSHGCVNMNTTDANWLYNWASLGTLVNVHY